MPVFGICYGFQAMAEALGGTVKRTEVAEFGRTTATVEPDAVLFAGQPAKQPVWMSHRDAVVVAPARVRASPGAPTAPRSPPSSIPGRRLFGMQWHPEVMHTAHGQTMLERFLHVGAGIAPTWTTANIIDDAIADVRERVGDRHVLCGLSGGVDSAVAAALVHRAVGDQLTCVFVDHGLLRKGEREQVERDYVAATGIRLVTVDASEKFLAKLARRHRSRAKRKIIGTEFIRTFEEVAAEVIAGEGSSREPATSSSSCRARSTPTSSSPAAAPAPPTSRATTTSAACPTTCSSS